MASTSRTTPVQLSDLDYQYAAEQALFGYLPVQPRVRPSDCEAHLFRFPKPIPDLLDVAEHEYGVFIITRGAQGKYRETVSLYAADENGRPVEREGSEGEWALMFYPRREERGSEKTSPEVMLDLLAELSRS